MEYNSNMGFASLRPVFVVSHLISVNNSLLLISYPANSRFAQILTHRGREKIKINCFSLAPQNW